MLPGREAKASFPLLLAAFGKQAAAATNTEPSSKLLLTFSITQPGLSQGHAGLVQGGSLPTPSRATAQGSDSPQEGGSCALGDIGVHQPPADHGHALTTEQSLLGPLSLYRQDQTSAISFATEEA